jgi:hypothetical protein
MPKTIENYSQEIGRAGRDGLPSTCLMLLSSPDIPVLEGFCRGDTCQKNSLSLWLQEVASRPVGADGAIGGSLWFLLLSTNDTVCIDFNLYQQSKV